MKTGLIAVFLSAWLAAILVPGSGRSDAIREAAVSVFHEVVFPEKTEGTVGGEVKVIGVIPTFLMVQDRGGLMQLVKVVIENGRQQPMAGTVLVERPDGRKWESPLELLPGRQESMVMVPDLREKAPMVLELRIGNAEPLRLNFNWAPARQWTVYLTQLSHFDIGYTAPQDVVMGLHDQYLDKVIEFYHRTRDWPADAQYRWTADGNLAIQHYLASHPEREADLKEMMQNGHLEVNAKLAHLCPSTAGWEMLAREVYYSKRDLELRFGVDVPTAILTDVPGLTWGDATVLAGAGVKYFLHHPNLTGRGADVVRAQDFPRAHYWQGPGGAILLTWRSRDSYVEGRFFIEGIADTAKKFPELLQGWEKDKYPYDIVHLTRSGLDPKTKFDDNSPPRFEICETVKAWNEHFAFPHIKTAIPRMFFEELERKYGQELPTYAGDMPDWWADGTLSNAKEEGISRDLHHRLSELEFWSAAARMIVPGYQYPVEPINVAHLDNYLFDEHTWGAMVPFMPDEEKIWKKKSGDLFRGRAIAMQPRKETLNELARQVAGDAGRSRLVVFNPLGWSRSETAEVKLGNDGDRPDAVTLRDLATGEIFPGELSVKRLGSERSALFSLRDVPALGYRSYEILNDVADQEDVVAGLARPEVGRGKPRPYTEFATAKENTLENQFFVLGFDLKKGGLRSLRDNRLNRELLDGNAPYALGQLIHRRQGPLDQYDLKTAALAVSVRFRTGPLTATAKVSYFLPTAPYTEIETVFTLCRDNPIIDVTVSLRHYHSGIGANKYVAFPFAVPDPEISLDIPWAVMRPGLDQLPGHANYYSVSHWVRLQSKSGGFGIAWSTREGPIVEFGAMTKIASFMNTRLNRPGIYDNLPPKPIIYSEIMHNFENTNYHLEQNGSADWHYRIAPYGNETPWEETARSGWELAQPLTSVMTQGNGGPLPASSSFVLVQPARVYLVTMKQAEDGRGLILRLYESSGQPATVSVNFPGRPILRATLTDIVERDQKDLAVKDGKLDLEVGPFSVTTVRVEF